MSACAPHPNPENAPPLLQSSRSRAIWQRILLCDVHGHFAVVLAMVTVASLIAATHLVYLSDGPQRGVPHLYYLPIMLGAFAGGWRAGALVGIAAGLLCGPLMPLSVEASTSQSTLNWTSRLGFFVLVGALVGLLIQQLRNMICTLDEVARQALISFVKTVDAKSTYTAEHSRNVARIARSIARQMGLDAHACDQLYWAGLLHDIGKIRIPDPVLNKQGPLDEHEWQQIRRHPIDSVHILENVPAFTACLPAIRHHHERVDGNGYPDGVSGKHFSRDARILAVADALEAMTADRPYRNGMPIDQALQRLHQGAGSQFDPDVVAAASTAFQHAQPDWAFSAAASPARQTDHTHSTAA